MVDSRAVMFRDSRRSDETGVRTQIIVVGNWLYGHEQHRLYVRELFSTIPGNAHGNPNRLRYLTEEGWVEVDYDVDPEDDDGSEGVPIGHGFLEILQHLQRAQSNEIEQLTAERDRWKELAEASRATLDSVMAAQSQPEVHIDYGRIDLDAAAERLKKRGES